MSLAVHLAEHGYLPDWLIRLGIRRLLRSRLEEESRLWADRPARQVEFENTLGDSPIAVHTTESRQQHYEVPSEFYQTVLGPHLKYSCGYWPEGVDSLSESEERMLELTAERAEISDGMSILDMGCGWGSLTLFLARRYPRCEITAVSHSLSQRRFIESRCAHSGIENVRVITSDINDFEPPRLYDRIVSIEMFEHLRNPQLLLSKISHWLSPSGKLFIHVFCHRDYSYLFDTTGDNNWMGRHFFTGGMMPGAELLPRLANALTLESVWEHSGLHYAKTSEAWLRQLDRHRDQVATYLQPHATAVSPKVLLQRWRLFFLACAELFRFRNGSEWFVSHYLFSRGGRSTGARNITERSHA